MGKDKHQNVDSARRRFLQSVGALTGLLALEKIACAPPKKPTGGEEIPPTPSPTYHDWYPTDYTEEFISSTCWIGKQDCSLFYRVVTQKVNGKEIKRVVKADGLVINKQTGEIEFLPDKIWKGDPNLLYNPRNRGTLCPKGVGANITALYAPNRIKYPLKRINAKGQKGRFVRISWDEALKTIADRLNEAKAKGEYVLWQKGRSKSGELYDTAFPNALKKVGHKVYKIGHGAFCSDAGYRATEYTIGQSAVVNPDFKYTEYIINVGTGFVSNSGGNRLCFITWPQMFIDARARGQIKKLVTLDPQRRNDGPYSDEWIPIKPGTDLAFFLGIAHYLLKNRLIDREYLKKYTNAPFLVITERNHKKQYYFVKDANGKAQVYDKNTGQIVPFDQDGIDPLLFTDEVSWNRKVKVNSGGVLDATGEEVEVKPAIEVFYDILKEKGWTADWADKTCDIPALTTARIARELWEHSGIKEGRTVTIGDKTFPLRPVSCMFYHTAQVEHGFQLTRAILLVYMLLGAVGVPGGVLSEPGKDKPHPNFESFGKMDIKTPPYDFTLSSSKYFPITTPNPSFLARVLIDPARYEVDESKLPKVMFVHMFHHGRATPDIPTVIKGYSKVDFIVFLTPWLGEGAQLLADIILPVATIEKYEGPLSEMTVYETGKTLRIPPVPPLWESKGEIDIYLDIAEAGGFLKEYIEEINTALNLGSYALDTSRKPTSEEIFDRWAKSIGKSGIDYFKKYGVTEVDKLPPEKVYPIAWSFWKGERMRFWGESLKKAQDKMKELGLDENKWIYVKDYFPVPLWREPTMEKAPGEYNFYFVNAKKIEYKQTRTAWIPIFGDIAPWQGDPENPTTGQVILINSKVAKELGINTGDEVYVESYNPMTGERRWVKMRANLVEYIRPDVVISFHHLGAWADMKPRGPSPNEIFYASEGFVAMTQDSSFQVKVKIYKA
ncbi:Polysulfide reductase chain A [bacterium HR19]|nr:Polysulfide reductase chain A [bacterium HR19]